MVLHLASSNLAAGVPLGLHPPLRGRPWVDCPRTDKPFPVASLSESPAVPETEGGLGSLEPRARMEISLSEERLRPLLHALESTIHRYYRQGRSLRDAEVIHMLQEIQRALRKNRPTEVSEGLARTLAYTLVEYSPDDYDATDQAMALRLMVASAKRHRRVDGARGYLEFLTRYAPLPEDIEK